MNSLLARGNMTGINWSKAVEVGISLLLSPLVGFVSAAVLLLLMKRIVRSPNLYHPPGEGDNPPKWIRGVLLATCGGVSLAHGSNDGQKGMGLILLVLISFLPSYYAINLHQAGLVLEVDRAAHSVEQIVAKESPETATVLRPQMQAITSALAGKASFAEVPVSDRWIVRQSIFKFRKLLKESRLSRETRRALAPADVQFGRAIEFVPYWVVVGVALALGVGTAIGYKRIVVTVAEKIGKSHLTYAQGAVAELVAAVTIALADRAHLPVSTTQVLSSGVAGTMAANRSGIQGSTVRKIGLAWVLTLPASILLSAGLFAMGGFIFPETSQTQVAHADVAVARPVAN
jgi:phosphate/sulfate permease